MSRKLLLVVVVGLVGCGGGGGGEGGSGGPPPPPPPLLILAPSADLQSLVMGQSTHLDAHATDPDGGTLTYIWTQTPASPAGTFSSTTSASPTWTAPTVGATTAFSLTVTVSDGHGDSASAPVKVFAKLSADPSFIADVQPLLLQCFGGCHIDANGQRPLSNYLTLLNWKTVIDCPKHMLIVPGDPGNSVLIKMVTGTSCGNEMPPAGPYLGTDEVDLLRTWISQGALDN